MLMTNRMKAILGASATIAVWATAFPFGKVALQYTCIYKDLQANSVQDINGLRTVHKYKLSDHTIE